MIRPLVSVVIPVYNVDQYINECVESVLNQTYSNYEVILVDDGSTDTSGALCDDYAEKYDCISTVHQENRGLSGARNTGLLSANGEYIYFLDSDDYIENHTLQLLVDTAQYEKADVVFFDGYVFFDNYEEDVDVNKYVRKKPYLPMNGRQMLLQLLKQDEFRTAVPLMLIKKEYILTNHLSFKEGIIHEDELFTFLLYNADGTFCHCNERLYARRMREASIMTASSLLNRYDSMLQIYIELSRLYKDGLINCPAGDLYIIRTAKSVLGKYAQLSNEQKEMVKSQHLQFKKNVMRHKGFGDMKLKIKCSNKLKNILYRVENKLLG